ncbi:MAG: SGNH/GDSL hydrolase family protein [Desulfomonilia bacterium]
MGTGSVINGPGQIIAIGDSLTAGSQPGVTQYAPFADIRTLELLDTTYPYILGEMLSKKWGGRLVLNLGRSGSTSHEWLPGAPWTKSVVKDFPLNGKPLDEIMESDKDYRVCLMMIGTNDANYSAVPDVVARFIGGVAGYENGDFLLTKENILACLIKLKERGLTTYLAKIPPNAYRGGLKYFGIDRLFFMTGSARERLGIYTKTINNRIEEILETYPDLARRGPDFHNLLKDHEKIWLKDRLHLNAEGYRLMAAIWADHLKRDGVTIDQG